ncbi:MAG: hypothetical protein ISS36_00765 [Candidatus Aenigmarchaeota archaeon]|nr:hypothetical protein [Candidatus Aenigmarchaeota archaeon]
MHVKKADVIALIVGAFVIVVVFIICNWANSLFSVYKCKPCMVKAVNESKSNYKERIGVELTVVYETGEEKRETLYKPDWWLLDKNILKPGVKLPLKKPKAFIPARTR